MTHERRAFSSSQFFASLSQSDAEQKKDAEIADWARQSVQRSADHIAEAVKAVQEELEPERAGEPANKK